MPAQTIDEVLTQLDEVIHRARRESDRPAEYIYHVGNVVAFADPYDTAVSLF